MKGALASEGRALQLQGPIKPCRKSFKYLQTSVKALAFAALVLSLVSTCCHGQEVPASLPEPELELQYMTQHKLRFATQHKALSCKPGKRCIGQHGQQVGKIVR